MSQQITPFETIRRSNPTGSKFCSSWDFAKVLDYADFLAVIKSALRTKAPVPILDCLPTLEKKVADTSSTRH